MAVLVPPLRGSSRLSVEEGFVRSIAVDALDAVGYGRNVLYDQMLPRNAGIGRLFSFFPSTIRHPVRCRQKLRVVRGKTKKREKKAPPIRPYWRFVGDSNRPCGHSSTRPPDRDSMGCSSSSLMVFDYASTPGSSILPTCGITRHGPSWSGARHR